MNSTAMWSHADTITETTSSSTWTKLKPGMQKRDGQKYLNCQPDSSIVSKPDEAAARSCEDIGQKP
jgi:hypothetical protein